MYSLEEVAPGLSAYAASIKFNAHVAQDTSTWEHLVREFFNYLSYHIKELPQAVIGHLKGYLNLEEKGYYYFSNVGSQAGTNVIGEASGQIRDARLDLNVLVFNLDIEQISGLVQQAIAKYFPCMTKFIEEKNEA